LKKGIRVAMHVACRFALIAFATIALRGLLDGTDFEATTQEALKVGALFGLAGLIVGDLARRLIEDLVAEALPQPLQDFAQHLGLKTYQFRTRDFAS